MHLIRLFVRPFGHLAFAVALLALSGAAWILGDGHDLGFFAGRLARAVWRYPEVTRRGVQMVWVVWGALFGIALSPLDPLATPWDEVGLAAAALAVVCRALIAGRRAAR